MKASISSSADAGEDKPSARHWIAAGAAALHLTVVAAFVWAGPPAADSAPERVLRAYQNLTGLFRDYTFFAPSVASDLRAGFLLDGGGDDPPTFISFLAQNREIGFRYNSLIASTMREPRGRDLFARSWAAFILGSQPDARRVTVVVEAYDVPSMEAFRAGEPARWRLVYAGQFSREP